MNGLVLGGLGYLFALQSHPNISAIGFAKAIQQQKPQPARLDPHPSVPGDYPGL
jgi:hypothetical protein